MGKGHEIGLLNNEVYGYFLDKKKKIEDEIIRIQKTRIKPESINEKLKELGTSMIDQDITLEQLLKRPEVKYPVIRQYSPSESKLGDDVEKQVEIQVKYAGYITRQIETSEKLKKLDEKKIPDEIDYKVLPGISKEILCKLEEVRPDNLGQASRIQGMTPAALSLIMIAIEKIRRFKGGP